MRLFIKRLLVFTFCCFSYTSAAAQYIALSTYIGGRTSEDLKESETKQAAQVGNALSQALLISWKHSRKKEGEILFSSSRHRLTSPGEQSSTSFIYSNYLHFGGRIFFTDSSPFSTSLASGIGLTFLTPDNSQYDNETALSGNLSAGLRYQLDSNWALRGDLRIYGTLLNSTSSVFCGSGECLISVNGKLYTQGELLLGIEYKF